LVTLSDWTGFVTCRLFFTGRRGPISSLPGFTLRHGAGFITRFRRLTGRGLIPILVGFTVGYGSRGIIIITGHLVVTLVIVPLCRGGLIARGVVVIIVVVTGLSGLGAGGVIPFGIVIAVIIALGGTGRGTGGIVVVIIPGRVLALLLVLLRNGHGAGELVDLILTEGAHRGHGAALGGGHAVAGPA
jgi:hypothetical protein